MSEPLIQETQTHWSKATIVDHGPKDELIYRFDPKGELDLEPQGEARGEVELEFTIGWDNGGQTRITSWPRREEGRQTYFGSCFLSKRHTRVEVYVKWRARLDAQSPFVERELFHSITLGHAQALNQDVPALLKVSQPGLSLLGQVLLPDEAVLNERVRWAREAETPPVGDLVQLYPGRELRLGWELRGLLEVDEARLEGGGWSRDVRDRFRWLRDQDRHVGALDILPSRHPPLPGGIYRLSVRAPIELVAELRVYGVVDFEITLLDEDKALTLYEAPTGPSPGEVAQVASSVSGLRGSYRDINAMGRRERDERNFMGIYPFDKREGTLVEAKWTVVAEGPDAGPIYLEGNRQADPAKPKEKEKEEKEEEKEKKEKKEKKVPPPAGPTEPALPATRFSGGSSPPAALTQPVRANVSSISRPVKAGADPTGLLSGELKWRERPGSGVLAPMFFEMELRQEHPGRPEASSALVRLLYDRAPPTLKRFDALDAGGAATSTFRRWQDVVLAWEAGGDNLAYALRLSFVPKTPGGGQAPAPVVLRKSYQRPLTNEGRWLSADEYSLRGEVELRLELVHPEDAGGAPLASQTRTRTIKILGRTQEGKCPRCPVPEALWRHQHFKDAVATWLRVEARERKLLQVMGFVTQAVEQMVREPSIDTADVWDALLHHNKHKSVLHSDFFPDLNDEEEVRQSPWSDTQLYADIQASRERIKAAKDYANEKCQELIAWVTSSDPFYDRATYPLDFQTHLLTYHDQATIDEETATRVYGAPPGTKVPEVDHWTALLTERLAAVPSGRDFLLSYSDWLHEHPQPDPSLAANYKQEQVKAFLFAWGVGKSARSIINGVAGKITKNIADAVQAVVTERPFVHTNVAGYAVLDAYTIRRLDAVGYRMKLSLFDDAKPETLSQRIDRLAQGAIIDDYQALANKVADGTISETYLEAMVERAEKRVSEGAAELRNVWFGAALTGISFTMALKSFSSDPKWGVGSPRKQLKDFVGFAGSLFGLAESVLKIGDIGLRANGAGTLVYATGEGVRNVESAAAAGTAKIFGALGALCAVVGSLIEAEKAMEKGQELRAALQYTSAGIAASSGLVALLGVTGWTPIGLAVAGLLLAAALYATAIDTPIEWLQLTPWGIEGEQRLPRFMAATKPHARAAVIDAYFKAIYGDLKVELERTLGPDSEALVISNRAIGLNANADEVWVSVVPRVSSLPPERRKLEDGKAARQIRAGDTSVGGAGRVEFRDGVLVIYRPWEVWDVLRDGDTEYFAFAFLSPDPDMEFELSGRARITFAEKVNNPRFVRKFEPSYADPYKLIKLVFIKGSLWHYPHRPGEVSSFTAVTADAAGYQVEVRIDVGGKVYLPAAVPAAAGRGEVQLRGVLPDPDPEGYRLGSITYRLLDGAKILDEYVYDDIEPLVVRAESHD